MGGGINPYPLLFLSTLIKSHFLSGFFLFKKFSRPFCYSSHQYALAIVGGRISACREIRHACRRYLDDFMSPNYVFRPDKAERACRFIQLLPHVKGQWASRRERLKLQPWQLFIVCNLFGWVDKSTGYRRFREAYLKIPRKSGKSILASAISLYMLVADGEMGAEIYAGAPAERKAKLVFEPAKWMTQRSKGLASKFGLEINAHSLVVPATNSKYEMVIGKPGDGSNPHCWVIDEYHEHEVSDQYESAKTGMGARTQPLLLVITTAGVDISSPCYDLEQQCVQMLQGTTPDEHLFAAIYGIDPEDDWKNPKNLLKANPNYNISVSGDWLKAELDKAISTPSKQNSFRIKHLNQWVNSKNPWLADQAWHACGDNTLREDDFKNETLLVGLDLSSKLDICAEMHLYTKVIEGQRHYYLFGKCYLPEETIIDSGNSTYQKWVTEGYLTPIPGAEIDQNFIFESVTQLAKTCKLREVVYDPYKAKGLIERLEEQNILTVTCRQIVANLSPAMREMEAAVASGRFHHNNNPLITWQFLNIVAAPDKKDNIYPNKQIPKNKIDAGVAGLMALWRAMTPLEIDKTTRSVYDDRDLRWL